MPRRRLPDVAFIVAAAIFSAFIVAALATGVGAAIAAASPAWHDRFHEMGVDPGLVGRITEAMADAAHRVQPPAQLTVDYLFSLLNLGLAAFLLRLRPRDLTARLLAVGMIGTAGIFNLQAYSVREAMDVTTADNVVHMTFHLVSAAAYIAALVLFPDGRPVPRWSWPRRLLLYVPVAAAAAFAGLRLQGASQVIILIMVFGLLTPLVGVASQAYRYGRSPTPVERQQSRLLFWALAPALVIGLFVLTRGISGSAFTAYQGRGIDIIPVGVFRVFQPVFAIIPIALFVGIVRFRLWNIDRFISRTLMYGFLAGFVSVVYVGVVVGLGRAIDTRGNNVVLSIVATGVIAVAFQPVRERVQRLADRLVYGQRATPYEVLSSFSEQVGTTVATEQIMARMARVLAEGTSARRADVWLVVGDEVRAAASWPQDDTPPDPRPIVDGVLPSLGDVTASCPVRHQGELLGALAVTKPPNETLSPTEEKLLSDLAAQAGLVLRNVRLTAELVAQLEELQASRERIVKAGDEARRQLERNIHDGAQQELVALRVKLTVAQRMAEQGKPVAALLEQINANANDAIENLRALARGIYPPLLASEGLAAALRAQADRAPIEIEIRSDDIGRFPKELEAAVYFCCLEALQNAAKYGGDCRAVVEVVREDDQLRFTVRDDGPGFDPRTQGRGAGTQNMTDRVEALGGTLVIDSAPGAGTTVSGSIPVPEDVEAEVSAQPQMS